MFEDIAKEYMALIPNLFVSFSELKKNSEELTHMQNHVVEFMFMQQRSVNIKEISTGLNIAKQQLTHIIGDLESGGHLVKMPDPKDKRAVLVSLTDKGIEIQQKKWTEIYRKFSDNLAKLNAEEQRDLNFALHKVNVLLKKMEE